jgi:hypothetical protein
VASLSRPGGNLTGVTFFGGSQLNVKRMELLHELVPKATIFAVFGDPGYPTFEAELPDVEAAATAMGLQIVVVRWNAQENLRPHSQKPRRRVQVQSWSAAVLFSPANAKRSLRSQRSMPFRQFTMYGAWSRPVGSSTIHQV